MSDKYGLEGMAWMKKKRFIESKVNQLTEGGKNIAQEAARRAKVETFKVTQKVGNKAVKLAQDPKVQQARQVSGEYWSKVQEGGKTAKTLLTQEMQKKNKLERLGRLGDQAIEKGKVKGKELKTKARGMAGQWQGGGGKRVMGIKSPWEWIKKKLD